MITKFLTSVSTRFNPFKKPGKTCRVFLAHLPANARQMMKINTQLLPRESKETSFLEVKFSTYDPCSPKVVPGLRGDVLVEGMGGN